MNIHLIKIYSLQNKIPIRKIAKDLGVSNTHIYNITAKKGNPSPKLAKKIEEYTHGEIKAIDLLWPKDGDE